MPGRDCHGQGRHTVLGEIPRALRKSRCRLMSSNREGRRESHRPTHRRRLQEYLPQFYYAVSRALWPGDRTPAAAILPAVLWGVIMEVLVMRRELLKNQPEPPCRPTIYLFPAIAGLSACVAYWAGTTLDPAQARLYSRLGLGLYLLAGAVTIARRRRARTVVAGT